MHDGVHILSGVDPVPGLFSSTHGTESRKQPVIASMSGNLVTREGLAEWGFVRLADTWAFCRSRKQFSYFETWYHPAWDFTAVLGLHPDPLGQTEESFLDRCQRQRLMRADELNEDRVDSGNPDLSG